MKSNNSSKIKPKEVMLWGIGNFAKQYMKYLHEAAIRVKLLVDTYKHGMEFNNKKVISSDEFKKNFNSYKNIPIVITGRGANDDDRFKQIVIFLTNYLGIKKIKILHPSFLSDFINLDYKGRVLKIGFPGSGNVLLTTIIRRLMEKHEKKYGKKELLFKRLAREHHETLTNTIDNIFYLSGMWLAFHRSQIKARYTIFTGVKNKGFINISNIRSNQYLLEEVHFTHSRPTKHVTDLFRKMNYLAISPIRNPLDIIISLSFKLGYPFVFMEPEKKFNQQESPFRESFGRTRLGNLEWFRSTAITLKEYLEEFLNNRINIRAVKYETLISKPVKSIHEIANYLQIICREEEIKKLWEEVGFKSLTNNKTHLFRPGAGKWKQYLTRQHIDILKLLKYEELLKAFDYNEKLESNKNLSDYDCIATDDVKYYLALQEYLELEIIGKPVNFSHKKVTYIDKIFSELKIATNSIEFLNSFNYALSSDFFKTIISSLDVSNYRERHK